MKNGFTLTLEQQKFVDDWKVRMRAGEKLGLPVAFFADQCEAGLISFRDCMMLFVDLMHGEAMRLVAKEMMKQVEALLDGKSIH